MKRDWLTDELAEHWTLSPAQREAIGNKSGPTRLGFAVLVKFFELEGRFPREPEEIPAIVIEHLAYQVGVPPTMWDGYAWEGRTIEYHRAQVRRLLGFREATLDDNSDLAVWLAENILPHERQFDRVKEIARERLRDTRIEPPSTERLDRVVRSVIHNYEERFCVATLERISSTSRVRLDELLAPLPPATEAAGGAVLNYLASDPGRAGLRSIEEHVAKLDLVRAIDLPSDLFPENTASLARSFRDRAAVEESFELRRHPQALRLTMLAAFCWVRARELVDELVELLTATVHRIGARAEQRVEEELLEDLRRVAGKYGLLYQVAEVSLAHPDGLVRDVVYPVINEDTLKALVKEAQASGPAYRRRIQTVIRNSYRGHYRRMLPVILRALDFRSNNEAHRPVIRALDLLRKYAGSKAHSYPPEEEVPIEDVVPAAWVDAVVEQQAGGPRVDRIAYEICALQALRAQLRCKEIWVPGADRFRNPDADLPGDFEQRRSNYYESLKLPRSAEEFAASIRREMAAVLEHLDRTLPSNPHVHIVERVSGRLSVSPLEAQPEPLNLAALKTEVSTRWPMTSLLDILKETDLRVGFSDEFKSPTSHESMDRAALQPRLLLSLYGLGTNTGIKRMSGGRRGLSYKDLLYVRRRFIGKPQLRAAIRKVTNATFGIRLPQIWGEGTTACASDSKKFSAWDGNLMTEWHIRYSGRGVMIYWHVERRSTCIYSQLKACSSSEVAAMIEGVLRHCTEMEIEKNYVDTHGQSTVGFAFCRLLGFDLLPRLKAIHKQKLNRPIAGQPDDYPNLHPILTRPIDWALIERQYDQMVKYTTALRLGTADAESILRRFTKDNVQHPTYKALSELGRAVKTIFLCRYLSSLEMRREIHEGLNIIENWNSAIDFIFFGKGSEIATNRHDDQEVAMLCLHLLQASLVYVNTLMIQRVLAEPGWMDRMAEEDFRALTPLVYLHVTPYGTFDLDMERRLQI
jgi:TnpA family transposase